MADVSYIDLLLADIEAGRVKFDWANQPETSEIRKWKAFRNSDKDYLTTLHSNWKAGRAYKVDPLPKRISLAFADFLYQEAPVVTPADEANREVQTDLLRETKFASRLRVAADICVSESQVWWHIFTDDRQSMWPILEWRSRTDVIPYMIGDTVLAAAFVRTYNPRIEGDPVYRHLEIHENERVANVLFKGASETGSNKGRDNSAANEGTSNEIGTRVELTEFAYTAEIEEEWNHGLPILAGRVKNEEDARSVYDGLEDFFLDLNEAHTVDSENFRLAGKKRAMIPKKYADQAGQVDAGEEIFFTESDNELDSDAAPIKILEYSYSAQDSIARKDDLANVALTRCGLARQLVDANSNEGLAQTGTALRTRLLPTTAALSGKAQEWRDELPTIVCRLQQVDALPEGNHGFGRPWRDPQLPPAIVLSNPFPIDGTEEAQRHQTLITAELESIETAIEELRPGWSKERRMLEVRRILANRSGYALDDDGNPVTEDSRTPNPPGERRTPDEPEEPDDAESAPVGGGAQVPPDNAETT